MTDILKSRGRAGNQPPAKRQHINTNASVIKPADYLKQIKDLSAQGAKKSIKRKKIVREVQTETDEESYTNIVYDDSEDASLNNSVDSSLDAHNIDTLCKSSDINLMEEKVESALPKLNEASIGKYYAVYYTIPALTYYWGKVLDTFENDPDADVNEAGFDFVKRKKISSDPSQITWTQPIEKNRDIPCGTSSMCVLWDMHT